MIIYRYPTSTHAYMHFLRLSPNIRPNVALVSLNEATSNEAYVESGLPAAAQH